MRFALGGALRCGDTEVGVVAGLGGVGAEVLDLVPESFELGDELALEVVASVIGGDRNLHPRGSAPVRPRPGRCP